VDRTVPFGVSYSSRLGTLLCHLTSLLSSTPHSSGSQFGFLIIFLGSLEAFLELSPLLGSEVFRKPNHQLTVFPK